MFDLEKFKTGEYYVHLPTQEIYNKTMKYLDDNGFTWVNGRSLTDSDRWSEHGKQTCIRHGKSSVLYSELNYYETEGYERLDTNEYEKGGRIKVNEKMKRDLIKLLFEKKFSKYEIEGMYDYKGRIIMDYIHRTTKFIDFIEMINENYNIKGHEVAEIIIEEFDLEEYKEEE